MIEANEIIRLFSGAKNLPIQSGGTFAFDRLIYKKPVIEILKSGKTIGLITKWDALDINAVKRSGAQLQIATKLAVPQFVLINKEQNWIYTPKPSPVASSDTIAYSIWSAIEQARQTQRSDGVFIKLSGQVKTVYSISRLSMDAIGLLDNRNAITGVIRTLSTDFLSNGVWSQVGKLPIRQICLNTAGERAKDLAEKYTIKTIIGKRIRSIEVIPEIARQTVFGKNFQSNTPSIDNFDIVASGPCTLSKISADGTYEITSSMPLWQKTGELPSGQYTPVWPLQLKEKENEIIIFPIVVPFGKLLNNAM